MKIQCSMQRFVWRHMLLPLFHCMYAQFLNIQHFLIPLPSQQKSAQLKERGKRTVLSKRHCLALEVNFRTGISARFFGCYLPICRTTRLWLYSWHWRNRILDCKKEMDVWNWLRLWDITTLLVLPCCTPCLVQSQEMQRQKMSSFASSAKLVMLQAGFLPALCSYSGTSL